MFFARIAFWLLFAVHIAYRLLINQGMDTFGNIVGTCFGALVLDYIMVCIAAALVRKAARDVRRIFIPNALLSLWIFYAWFPCWTSSCELAGENVLLASVSFVFDYMRSIMVGIYLIYGITVVFDLIVKCARREDAVADS